MPRRIAIPLAAVATLLPVWSVWTVFAESFNQCDNVAGTCIRLRQRAAILLLHAATVVGLGACVWAWVVLAGGRFGRRLGAALV